MDIQCRDWLIPKFCWTWFAPSTTSLYLEVSLCPEIKAVLQGVDSLSQIRKLQEELSSSQSFSRRFVGLWSTASRPRRIGDEKGIVNTIANPPLWAFPILPVSRHWQSLFFLMCINKSNSGLRQICKVYTQQTKFYGVLVCTEHNLGCRDSAVNKRDIDLLF